MSKFRLWVVQIVEAVKIVHHRGQKSEIRDQLFP